MPERWTLTHHNEAKSTINKGIEEIFATFFLSKLNSANIILKPLDKFYSRIETRCTDFLEC